MKLPRRNFLHLAAGAAALPAVSRIARAQAYPSRPVRIVVAFPAGGPNDVHARLMGQWLSERLGQPFVVENRPGAGGNLGTEVVVRSPPDGYTLLLLSTANSTNPAIYEKLNYDLIRDIAPVAAFFQGTYVMLVNPSVPAKTIPEFIAYAKANPGKINMGSNGVGAAGHLAGELFKMMTGIDMLHVAYRGEAPALTDLLSGQVQAVFASTTGAIEFVRSNQLRALGVTTATRSPGLPDIPSVSDFVPGYEVSSWVGMGAPKNTPTDVIDKLNTEINFGSASPLIKARYAELGVNTFAVSPATFGSFIAGEIQKWTKVVKFAGIKPI
jgi:tripartite-type tricarboxylate transporter receptor subunit TctC